MQYCKLTPERIDTIIEISLIGTDGSEELLAPALITGSKIDYEKYFNKAAVILADVNYTSNKI